MKKKVYSITFHNANNYGAVIQAYALQKILAKKYETKIVDYDNQEIAKGYHLFNFVTGNHSIKQFVKDVLNLKKEYLRRKSFDNFRRKIELTEKINGVEDLKTLGADAFVVGSDQIWNPNMTGGVDEVYTLNYDSSSCKKIAYAASAGSNEAFSKYGDEYIERIKKFDAVSVRETALGELLSGNVSGEVETVLDPSLLLSKEEWSELAGDTPMIKEKYVFVYCGDEPDYFYDIVNEYARENDATIVHFGRRDTKNKFKYRKKSMYEVGPVEFVNLVKFSTCVITASFHGTALGVLMNKDLLIVLNKYQDRLETLMRTAGLTNRIVGSLEEYRALQNDRIDWKRANAVIEKKRTESIDWLYGIIDSKVN